MYEWYYVCLKCSCFVSVKLLTCRIVGPAPARGPQVATSENARFGSGPYGARWQNSPNCGTLRGAPPLPWGTPHQLLYFLINDHQRSETYKLKLVC